MYFISLQKRHSKFYIYL